MRFETRTERAGERVGDIDWDFDFLSHFQSMCTNDERKAEACEESKSRLRVMEGRLRQGLETMATTDGGWPRCGWGEVLDVGMYDGWPFWRPVPSVFLSGVLGASWHPFSSITSIRHEQDTPDEFTQAAIEGKV